MNEFQVEYFEVLELGRESAEKIKLKPQPTRPGLWVQFFWERMWLG